MDAEEVVLRFRALVATKLTRSTPFEFKKKKNLPDELNANKTMSIGVFGRNADFHRIFDLRSASGDVFISDAIGARIYVSSRYLRSISSALYL